MDRDGCLYIPRVVQDTEMDQCIQTVTQNPVRESPTYLEGNRAVALKVGTLGLLDRFYFAEDETLGDCLKPEDVQIQVKASALNFRDLMTALGKIPYELFGYDCAGVVTAVEDDVSDLAVGDRVYAFATAAFVTVVRIPETTNLTTRRRCR